MKLELNVFVRTELEAPLLIGSDTEGELFIEVVSLNKRYCQCILLLLNAYAGKTAK